jgi:uncharacterized protein YjeT (DUF2065 family)
MNSNVRRLQAAALAIACILAVSGLALMFAPQDASRHQDHLGLSCFAAVPLFAAIVVCLKRRG